MIDIRSICTYFDSLAPLSLNFSQCENNKKLVSSFSILLDPPLPTYLDHIVA